MAKVKVTGAREWEMEDEKTGRSFSGFTVYYENPIVSNDGKFGEGYTSGKLKVSIGSSLYKRLLGVDFSEPFEAEPLFEFVPGSKNAVLVDLVF